MSGASITAPPLSKRADVRAIVLAWRELTGGTGRGRDDERRTLVACSGGADSSALALALTTATTDHIVLGHVVHDLRPPDEAAADRDAVRDLATRLGLEFLSGEIRVASQPGNAESNARRERYQALERLASEAGCPYVATAHHADDQLETILMRVIRGAGPRGLAGIHDLRPLSGGGALIRPMLGIQRSDAEAICEACGWAWREDRTNTDASRLRAALRTHVTPEIRRIRSDAARNAARSARLSRQAADVVRERVEILLRRVESPRMDVREVPRDLLASEAHVTVGELLRCLSRDIAGRRGQDALGWRTLEPVLRGIGDHSGETRSFSLGPVRIEVDRGTVRLQGVWGRKRSMEEAPAKVVLVGHCRPDEFMLRNAVTNAVGGAAEIVAVTRDDDLEQHVPSSDLLLVNRALDGRFKTGNGIELIRMLLQRDPSPTVMLVSDRAEAQAEAEAAGAMPGFGKTGLYDALTKSRLQTALGSGAEASSGD